MKFIDLFCGAGGLSCGLEQAGFTCVLANEVDPLFSSTYHANNPAVQVITGDIRQLSAVMLDKALAVHGEIDLVVGGPPCQGYSVIAPERTLADPRNHLFKEFLRIVKHAMPKAVIIENVPGIVSFEHGLIVEQIYNSLEKLGYNVAHKILFAAHYGVPQMRFRTFFIGILNFHDEIIFPWPTHKAEAQQNFTKSKNLCFRPAPLQQLDMLPAVGVNDAIGDLPAITAGSPAVDYDYPTAPATPFQVYARQGSDKITSHYCSRLSTINKQRLQHIPQGGSWRDIPFDLLPAGLKRARRSDHTQRYGRLKPNGLCSTLQTKCDPHWGCFFHPDQDRVISVREAARLQSFQDKTVFLGNMTQQYRQIGNAVPPLLAKCVGACVAKMIGE